MISRALMLNSEIGGSHSEIAKATPSNSYVLPWLHFLLFGIRRWAILFCLLTPPLEPSDAQDRLLPVYQFQRINGLTTDQIRSHVVRDRSGFIWIGTLNGLNRYDGYSVKEYRHDPGDPHSLSSNIVKDLFVDKSGRLWVGTFDSGLSLYDPGHDWFINLLPRHGDSSWYDARHIYEISEDRSGNLWLGTIGSGAICLQLPPGEIADLDSIARHIRWTSYAISTRDNSAGCVLEREDGTFFVASDSGVVMLNPLTHVASRLHFPGQTGRRLDRLIVNCMLVGSRGNLWIGTNSEGLFRVERDHKTVTHYRHREEDDFSVKSDAIWDLAEDRSGNIWIGSGGGIDLFSPITGRRIPYLAIGLGAHWPTSWMRMSLDVNNVLWIGTMDGGVHFLSPESWRFPLYSLPRKDGISPVSFWRITRDHRGAYWCMTSDGNLYDIDFTNGRVLRSINVLGLKQTSYTDGNPSFIDTKGFYWLGTWGLGLYRVDLRYGGVRRYNVELGLGTDRIVNGIAQGEGDTLWLAKEFDGLKKFDPASKSFTGIPGLPIDNVYDVLKDRLGMIWMSSEADGIKVLDPTTGSIKVLRHDLSNPRSLSNDHARYLYEDSSGRIWVGAGNQVNLWEPSSESFTRYNNPLFNKALFADVLGLDQKGKLWVEFLGSGVSVLDPSNGIFTNYDGNDGIFGSFPMATLSDGRVVIPHWAGINIFHPDSIDAPRPPPPFLITTIRINDTTSFPPSLVDSTRLLSLSHEQNVLEFGFAAIDPGATHRIAYLYRLDGLEKDWVHPDARQYVRYPGLGPGKYVFRVKAINTFDRWPDQEIALAITITPPWWRTWWAYAVYTFFVVGLLSSIYRVRLRQIQLHQQVQMERLEHERALDRERVRISQDMHDEVGASLSEISILSELARRNLQKPEEAAARVQEISERSGEVITNIGEIIWAINPTNDPVDNLISYLRRYAVHYLGLADITCMFSVADEIPPFTFSSAVRRNIFLVVKEALHNVVKHAVASEVTTRIEFIEKGMEIRIEDNGKGFVPEEHYGSGNGLTSMQQRLSDIGATIRVESEPGCGTKVLICV